MLSLVDASFLGINAITDTLFQLRKKKKNSDSHHLIIHLMNGPEPFFMIPAPPGIKHACKQEDSPLKGLIPRVILCTIASFTSLLLTHWMPRF